MSHYALIYEAGQDLVERRAPYRDEHLRLVREAHERGEIVMAGALGDPPDGSLLVFRVESAEAVEAFARGDPYVINGVIRRWQVRPWTLVVGQ